VPRTLVREFSKERIMSRISYNLPNHAHFLTFSCYHRQQLLTSEDVLRLLTKTWDEARRRGDFDIWSYVILPEHVHLLIYPRNEKYEMSTILRLLKEQFTHRVVTIWQKTSPPLLEMLRVERGERSLHRFWQEGGGYDRNLYNWNKISSAIDYIEWNPVRRGLVSDPLDWEWSSARARTGIERIPLVIDKIQVEV